ncbi:MAG: hypothetical protein MUF00_16155 [Gemmatimonadaceae bacterium]|jgi:hypothetical protein|nr:hypothetical protein [Gemmatimonadaceae bacterium]
MRRAERDRERVVWRRFRADGDRYLRLRQGALYVARVAAVAERVVDLLHTLSEELDEAIDVRIDDVRRGLSWIAREVPRAEVRDVLTRLKLPLATYGGVEVTLVTPQDQLTLTPELLLFVMGRSDRWWRVLEQYGLRAQRTVDEPQWVPDRAHLRPVREVSEAVDAAVRQLELQPVASRMAATAQSTNA